jgi:glycosyltransferase involved in cell wall biosynthesis
LIEDSSLVVFANLAGGGVVKPGMSGGDKIAIECLRRWTHSFKRIFVVTTLAGKEMYSRNDLQGVDYLISTRLILSKHSLLNNIALQILAAVKSSIAVSRLMRHLSSNHIFMYSTSDFPGDFLPVLASKILRPRTIWAASFFLFAPSPVSKQNPYKGAGAFKAGLWHFVQISIFMLTKSFANLIFVTNDIDRERFLNKEGSDSSRVIAVRGGVDLKLLRDVPQPSVRTFDAVFVGRLHPQKGVLELIDIWRLVCRKFPDAHLALIGNGELEDELRQRISSYGLDKSVEMLGFVDGRRKIEIFKQSKIVLHPAIYDSGGMAPAEAMACGLPGVCFDLPVLRTYYPRGMIRVARFDIEQFAQAIVRLLTDSELYSRMSSEAVEETNSWDWDSKAKELLGSLKETFNDKLANI